MTGPKLRGLMSTGVEMTALEVTDFVITGLNMTGLEKIGLKGTDLVVTGFKVTGLNGNKADMIERNRYTGDTSKCDILDVSSIEGDR